MKIGVIGVGHLGQHHARIFSELDDSELIGVYDIDFQRAETIAQQNHCKKFQSVKDLLKKVDAVSIATPTTTHFNYCKESLNAGKHIFVEKPICSNLEDAKELVSIAKNNNLKIQVGHIERFNPAIMALSKILLNPIFIEANRIAPFTPRGSDVPVVLDLMIHDIDIILSLMRTRVKNIKAVGIPILTNDIDIANAKIEFENGALANITASRISLKRERKIRFFQKNMYISLDYQKKDVQVVKKCVEIEQVMKEIMSGKRQPDISELYNRQKLEIIEKEPLKSELENFVDAIQNNKRPIVNGRDGYEALRVAFMIMKDIEKNRKESKLI